VHDTFVAWQEADRQQIASPAAWLKTVCTRRCLDLLRSAHRSRVDYVGSWLPEPIHTAIESEAGQGAELASSITTAFLLMLERLTPKERAAYLLHEIFDTSYADIAETLGMEEAACRKLVSRARESIDRAKVRHVTAVETQDRLLAAFRTAITTGTTEHLAGLLSADIRLTADGGGKVPAVLHVISGIDDVLDFLIKRVGGIWAGFDWRVSDINGARGFILEQGAETVATVGFAYDEDGRVTDVFVVRNPDKLARLDSGTLH
jgi:RNA polymerase sigma-70 factor (ECF subfamily)